MKHKNSFSVREGFKLESNANEIFLFSEWERKARMYTRDTSSCRKSSQINDSMEYILDMILSKNEIFLFMALLFSY